MTVARWVAVAVTLVASVAVPSSPNVRTFGGDNSSRVNRSVRVRSNASRNGQTSQSCAHSIVSPIEQQKPCAGADESAVVWESPFPVTQDEFSRLEVPAQPATLTRACQLVPTRAPPFLL